MSRTVSVEQIDGKITELEQSMEKIETQIIALKDLRVMCFGAADGDGKQDKKLATTGATNQCLKCSHRWPRTKGRQVTYCPECGEDWRRKETQ